MPRLPGLEPPSYLCPPSPHSGRPTAWAFRIPHQGKDTVRDPFSPLSGAIKLLSRDRRRVRLVFLGGGVVVCVAHVMTLSSPFQAAGLLLVLDHAFALALTLALSALAMSVGQFMFRRASFDLPSGLEGMVLSLALGFGVLAVLILVLAAVGLLHPLSLVTLLFSVWFVVRREWPQAAARAVSSWRELLQGPGPSLAIILVAGIALLLLLRSLAPATDYDSLMYHLRIPRQFLQKGALHVPADNLHVAYVGLWHMLYLVPLALGAEAACAILNVIAALCLTGLLLMTGRKLFSRSAGTLAMVAFWGSPMAFLVAATPKVDLPLSLFVYLAHYALLEGGGKDRKSLSWTALAGLYFGMAVGVKILALPYLAAVTPLLLFRACGSRWSVRVDPRSIAVFFSAVLLACTPWMLKNWVLLGAPLYPYFADRILPPWLAAIQGSSTIPPELGSDVLRPLLTARKPFHLLDWFLSPGNLTPEGEGGAYRANFLFLGLLAGAALFRHLAFAAVAGPPLLYLLLIVVWNPLLNLRYLLPAFPALTLAAAQAFVSGVSRLRRPRLTSPLLSLLAVATLVPTGWSAIERIQATRPLSLALGLVSRESYLLRSDDPETSSYAAMTRWVDRHVPRDATILFLFEARGYRFQPRVLQDNVATNWPLLVSVLADSQCLASWGVSHVLVGTGTLEYFRRRGFDPAYILWDRFPAFRERCLELVERTRGFELYRTR